MTYQELSPQGEALLKEIIDLQTSGKDNTIVAQLSRQKSKIFIMN